MTPPSNKQHLQPTKQHCQEESKRKKQMVSYFQHIHFMKSSKHFQTLQHKMTKKLENPLFHTPTLSPTKEEMFTCRPILGSASLRSYQTETPVQGHNDSLRIPLLSNQKCTVSAAAQAAGSDAIAGDGTHSDDLSSLNPTEQNKSTYAQKKYDGRNKRLRYNSCNNIVSCWLPLFFILCCGLSMVKGIDPIQDLSELKSAINTYQDAATISKYGPIDNWDVSRVTSLASAFYNKGTFNADLSKWDVSRVTNMYKSKCSDLKCSPPFFFSFHI